MREQRNEVEYIIQRQKWVDHSEFVEEKNAYYDIESCRGRFPNSKFRIVKRTTIEKDEILESK